MQSIAAESKRYTLEIAAACRIGLAELPFATGFRLAGLKRIGLIPAKKPAMLGRMALKMRWVGDEELDRVAETRWMCYGHARKDLVRFKENIHAGPWGRPGDYLLAERERGCGRDGEQLCDDDVGARVGGFVPGRGVCGDDQERSPARGTDPGVGSAVMREVLRIGRERQQVVSALMPFRASFYEHFGYGLVERRADWTIPLVGFAGGGLRGMENQHARGSDGADGPMATFGGGRAMRHRAVGRAMEKSRDRMKRTG
jgi:hypothetical protein